MRMNLKENPFFLDDADIEWVEATRDSMTLEEKIGQLFIMLDRKKDREEEKMLIQQYHLGGCRYENESADAIYEQNKYYQQCAKIPLLTESRTHIRRERNCRQRSGPQYPGAGM